MVKINDDYKLWILTLVILSGLTVYFTFNKNFFGFDFYGMNVEMAGMIVTLILFVILFRRADVLLWKEVEGTAKKLIKIELRGTVLDIINFLDTPRTVGGGVEGGTQWEDIFENSFQRRFNYVAHSRETVPLNNIYQEALLKGKKTPLFEMRKNNISMLELKYSKFLNPKTIKSLMLIQLYLNYIHLNIAIGIPARIPEDMNKIIKEIYEIHKSEISIYDTN